MDKNEGWKSRESAEHYSKIANILVPNRQDILSTIAKLSINFASDDIKVLDIGCGYGDVTAEILKYNSNAMVYMVDFSDEMIKLSNDRFKDQKNIKILKHDLNQGIPQDLMNDEFDSVVSCFALHHVDFQNRVKLYSDIRASLKDEGIFVNGDLFKGDAPNVDQWEFNNWIEWMRVQIKEKLGTEKTFDQVKETQLASFMKLGDKPGTVWNMYMDLKEAGFEYVDCICKYQNLSVITARK